MVAGSHVMLMIKRLALGLPAGTSVVKLWKLWVPCMPWHSEESCSASAGVHCIVDSCGQQPSGRTRRAVIWRVQCAACVMYPSTVSTARMHAYVVLVCCVRLGPRQHPPRCRPTRPRRPPLLGLAARCSLEWPPLHWWLAVQSYSRGEGHPGGRSCATRARDTDRPASSAWDGMKGMQRRFNDVRGQQQFLTPYMGVEHPQG